MSFNYRNKTIRFGNKEFDGNVIGSGLPSGIYLWVVEYTNNTIKYFFNMLPETEQYIVDQGWHFSVIDIAFLSVAPPIDSIIDLNTGNPAVLVQPTVFEPTTPENGEIPGPEPTDSGKTCTCNGVVTALGRDRTCPVCMPEIEVEIGPAGPGTDTATTEEEAEPGTEPKPKPGFNYGQLIAALPYAGIGVLFLRSGFKGKAKK